MFKKGIGVIVLLFDVTLCLLILHSLRLSHFPFCLLLRVRGWKKTCLFILASHIISPEPASVPAQVKPPITQVYTWRQHPLVSSPSPVASTLDPVFSDDLPIAFCKGKRQCAHPIFSFCSYDHLSSLSCSFTASLVSISLPNKVFEALAHPGWHSAMIEEMDALTDNSTGDLVR